MVLAISSHFVSFVFFVVHNCGFCGQSCNGHGDVFLVCAKKTSDGKHRIRDAARFQIKHQFLNFTQILVLKVLDLHADKLRCFVHVGDMLFELFVSHFAQSYVGFLFLFQQFRCRTILHGA